MRSFGDITFKENVTNQKKQIEMLYYLIFFVML